LKSKDNAFNGGEDFNFEAPKTKDFKEFLEVFGLRIKKSFNCVV